MGNKVKSFGLVGLGVVAGITVSLQFSAIAQKVSGDPAPLPLQELRELTDVFGLIKTDYVEPVNDKKLLTDAISGMVASLDPHSVYLDKKAFREMRETVSGKFVGIGIEVGNEDGYIKVISPIEDSPAFKAGIKAGDLITRIDGTPIKGQPLDDAVKKMRGEPHSKVELTITRKDEAKPLVFRVAREEIRVQSVKAKPGTKLPPLPPAPVAEEAKVAEQKPAEVPPQPAEKAAPAAAPSDIALAPAAPDGAFASLRGELRAPVAGKVAAKFGAKRGDGPSWKGVFIRASEGSDVHAVAAGRVVFAEWLRGFGNLIIVDHGGQYMSIYGNNQSLLKRAGDLVKAGDTIASAGNSGGNEESGLYFELRHQGRAFDPAGWVKF